MKITIIFRYSNYNVMPGYTEMCCDPLCYFAAGSYFTLIEHMHVKITIIFRYSNYNVMPTSTSRITICYILNIHNLSNVDSDYLP